MNDAEAINGASWFINPNYDQISLIVQFGGIEESQIT